MRTAAITAAAAVTLSLPAPTKPPPTLEVHADTRTLMAAARAPVAPVEQPWTVPDKWAGIIACESGDWIDGVPQLGTHRWDYGVTFDHGDIYEGAPNFHPATWDAYRDPTMPDHAGHATPQDQIAVAERVLTTQGWQAWPVCSRMAGYR